MISLILTVTLANAQEFKIEERSVIGTFELADKSKSELFSAINKWISINYNSSKSVIQMNDLESGTIIIKGINYIIHRNPYKIAYPNSKQVPETQKVSFNHLIEINIKDNRYRIIVKFTDMTGVDSYYPYVTNLLFNCINFKNIDEYSIQAYNNERNDYLKKQMVGAKKRESYMSFTKEMVEEINTKLIEKAKSIMLSVQESVSDETKDDW
jgi:hypothetical protein